MKRSFVMFLLAAGVLLLALQPTAPPPAGAHTGNRYHAIPQHSFGNKCLSMRVADGYGNKMAEQYLCNNANDQQFDITHFSDGWHQIKFKSSGKCLDVAWGSTENGAQLIEYTCHGGDNQKFDLASLHGRDAIVNKKSGKCLDVFDAQTATGADIVQWQCNGQANQLWGLHNDTATRLKTTFPDGWSWVTLITHLIVGEDIADLWSDPYLLGIINWNATATSVDLEQGSPNWGNDIGITASMDGCWNDFGQQRCVPDPYLGYTWWLGFNREFVCPSDFVGLNCGTDPQHEHVYRQPAAWWHSVVAVAEDEFQGDPDADFYRTATIAHELGHALGLMHDGSPNAHWQTDGLCGNAPMKRTLMDYDCTDPGLANPVSAPQPWDSCGMNHLYYISGSGYSGC